MLLKQNAGKKNIHRLSRGEIRGEREDCFSAAISLVRRISGWRGLKGKKSEKQGHKKRQSVLKELVIIAGEKTLKKKKKKTRRRGEKREGYKDTMKEGASKKSRERKKGIPHKNWLFKKNRRRGGTD